MCKTHSHAEIGFLVHVFGFVAPFHSFAIVYLSSGSKQQSSYEFNLNPLMHHFHWMMELCCCFDCRFFFSALFFLVYLLDLELSQGTSSDFTFTLHSSAAFLFVRLPLAEAKATHGEEKLLCKSIIERTVFNYKWEYVIADFALQS